MEKAKVPSQRNFKDYLQKDLAQRCKKNPQYSLRSYAQLLKISPAMLSRILSGRREASPELVSRVGERLMLSPRKIREFYEGADVEATYSNEFEFVEEDAFQLISEWYHFALLELLQFESRSSAVQLSKRLGISQHEVSDALNRLQKAGLIKAQASGWQVISKDNSFVLKKGTSAARKLLQKSILGMAREAIETVDYEMRDNSSLTVAIDTKNLKELQDLITDFRCRFNKLIKSKTKKPNQVYQLSIALFPLTKMEAK